MTKLIFQSTDFLTFGGNHFRDVPIILRFDDTNLVEVVKHENLGLTTSIPIYNADGTYLAKVVGTRVFLTEDGKEAGISIVKEPGLWVCEMDKTPVFEVRHNQGESFRLTAELYTDTGYFVKSTDSPTLYKADDKIALAGLQMRNCKFSNCDIGIWIKSNGELSIGSRLPTDKQ